MTTDLTLLGWSAVLAFVQMCTTAGFITLTYGIPAALGNRAELPAHTGALLRSTRALQNMVESLVIFAAAVLAVHAAGREDGLTALGAELFFWSRLAYLPIYIIGVPYLRTIVWTIAITGIALVLARLL